MAILRRRPAPAAPAAPTFRRAPPPKAQAAEMGEVKFCRVWNKDDPKGRTDSQRPHWYFDARSREGAINAMARRSGRKADTFDAEYPE